jgi:CRISPR/Cas system CSM-associated protein Csm3 (group 7 of RAMP superfamily)
MPSIPMLPGGQLKGNLRREIGRKHTGDGRFNDL